MATQYIYITACNIQFGFKFDIINRFDKYSISSIIQHMDNNDPIITQENPEPFIVRVKLLTNQNYQFKVDKNMKVAEFKKLISPQVKVPVDRMRIVFSGKQLLDQRPLSDYVTQSGLTVHLIARTAPVPQQNPPQQSNPHSVPNNPNEQSNPMRPPQQQMPINPFGDIMGMVNSFFGSAGQNSPSPQITMSFGNVGSGGMNNNPLGNILGGLGIRIPVPQTSTIPNNPPQPIIQQGQQNSSQQSQQPRISYNELSQLNQNLNSLNIPLDNIITQQQTLTPESVIRYLRRLHHQSSRSMLQLNRLLNLAQTNNNNTSSLQSFVLILQSLNQANNVAIRCLNQLQAQRTQQALSSQRTTNNTQTRQSAQMQNIASNNMINRSSNNQRGSQQSSINQHLNQSSQSNQVNNNAGLGNPFQMLGGFNLGNLMGSLQSVGGVGGLFGMTLNQMMSQGSEQTKGIFFDIFGGMTGQNMMQMFTTKDFKFLKQKRAQIRQKLLKHINEKGQQAVIEQIAEEASNILIPNQAHPMINNLEKCQKQCKQNLMKQVKALVKLSISQNEPQYDVKVIEIGKVLFCQNIKIIVNNTSGNNQNVAFQIIKKQSIQMMDPVLPGISTMFYGLIQRDLMRVYNEYKVEQQRRRQMSAQETQSQQKLIQIIKQAGKNDSKRLSQMPHSQLYYSKNK